MIADLRHRLQGFMKQVAKAYVDALYRERPVFDETTGKLIGHEWYTIRGDRVHFTSCEQQNRQNQNKDRK